MANIQDARIAILATNGFEKSELEEPKRRLKQAGAAVSVISPEDRTIQSWDKTDWGDVVAVDMPLDAADPDSFDVLVLPGGQINPDVLRTNADAVGFIRRFVESGKPVAAICHAPWLLIEAKVIEGRECTSYHSIRTDVENAGGRWRDEEVVVDGALITSRNPGDLDAFVAKIVEAVEGDWRDRRAA
jgi:protease I